MTAGLVFDIQRYAVHDGPGIRTLVFLKGCPLRCPWCCNPESQALAPELKRSLVRCRACGSCAPACPEGKDPRTLGTDREECAACGSWPCLEACPHGALGRVGREMGADELLVEVLKDRAFYENSGGGVTLSGGEPLAQGEFVEEFLAGCKDAGIHAALETCGFATPETLRRVEPLADLIFFDLKLADPSRHLEVLGVPLAPILVNLSYLASRRASDVVVRVPVVPGFTDGEGNLRGLAKIAADLGLRRVELEPYHALGEAKYRELGRELALSLSGVTPSAESLRLAQGIFREAGLTCTVEGF